eukprot:TRINITY_DN19018_c0_g1_i1.p1 TRINITY_DN19018_c0_g1~~TRINITY_DN19018_c0_g1_i1.p1  ORF type:complete len:328 (+),score=5.50 TRINITY_DN19018_c0_g1_i1:448-1431(+)
MSERPVSVLVTGANGFVGRSVVAALAANDRRAVFAAVRNGSAALCSGKDNVKVLSGLELNNPDGWSDALAGVNAVVHCAARAHIMNDTSDDPLAEFRKVNVEGTLALAKSAADAGVSRFIYLSSVKALGESTDDRAPFTLNDQFAPEDPYGESKAEAERKLQALCSEAGMELVIIRPPLVYGPGVGGNFVSLVKLANTPLPLPFGKAVNRRSMVYVDNLADFIVRCVDCPDGLNQAFLVSDGQDLSTEQLVTLLREGLGRPRRLVPVPESIFRLAGRVLGKTGLVTRLFGSLQVDTRESAGILGWTPPYSAGEAVKRTARSFSDSSA